MVTCAMQAKPAGPWLARLPCTSIGCHDDGTPLKALVAQPTELSLYIACEEKKHMGRISHSSLVAYFLGNCNWMRPNKFLTQSTGSLASMYEKGNKKHYDTAAISGGGKLNRGETATLFFFPIPFLGETAQGES